MDSIPQRNLPPEQDFPRARDGKEDQAIPPQTAFLHQPAERGQRDNPGEKRSSRSVIPEMHFL